MRRSILSINGNRSMNFIVQTVLSPRYNILPVGDVYQGMNELRKRDGIELIIVDVDYHTQESLDFIHHVKTSGLYQDCIVIVLASEESLGRKESAMAGIAKVFHKPFSPEELVEQIDEMLNKRFEKIS